MNSNKNAFQTKYQDFIRLRTYARYLPQENRRETWDESVKRYSDFFFDRIPEEKRAEWQEATKAISNIEVMPSMRALWTAGEALERENSAAYNCSFTHLSRVESFSEMLYLLMNGAGVGYSVERQYITKLPTVPDKLVNIEDVIVVEDSKEGWAIAYNELLQTLYGGRIPKVDYSQVRPEGSPLKVFGGRASGPAPLEDLVQFTINTFKEAVGRKLNSLEVHDMACYICKCVVSGGVRRSSAISLSNRSDDRMAHAKDGAYWETAEHRANANNSIAYTEKPTVEQFMEDWLTLKRSGTGERGIFNRESAEFIASRTGRRNVVDGLGCNPCCFTGDMRLLTDKGYVRFDELVGKDVNIVNPDGNITKGSVWSSGIKEVIELNTSLGTTVRCTPDHVFRLANGQERQAHQLLGQTLDSERHMETPVAEVVMSIHTVGEQEVFDFTEPETHWGVVEGLVVHNSEIILRDREMCNLSEVVIRPTDTLKDIKEKVRKATILGCLQSTLTDFNFLSDKWAENMKEERLLGVSLTGLRDHKVLGKVSDEAKVWLTDMKNVAIQTAQEWSSALGINMPAAITCTKPSGTVSQLVSCASGLHPRPFRYYVRRVRISTTDPLFQMMKDKGFSWKPENDQMEDTCNTAVFSFPLKAPEGAIVDAEVDALEQLEYWLMLQQYWCEHKPSITVTVNESEWIRVASWLYDHWQWVSGLSFMPKKNTIYRQAPQEEIDESTYLEMVKNIPDIDFSELPKWEIVDATEGSREFACAGGACELG